MSASELKRRLLPILDNEIADNAARALDMGPGNGLEEIAFGVLAANSFRRGVEWAKARLIEEHQKLVAPDTVPRNAEPLEEGKSSAIY